MQLVTWTCYAAHIECDLSNAVSTRTWTQLVWLIKPICFLEGENAPAADIATIIDRVYKENQATILVASRSNKVRCDLKWVRVVLILAFVV